MRADEISPTSIVWNAVLSVPLAVVLLFFVAIGSMGAMRLAVPFVCPQGTVTAEVVAYHTGSSGGSHSGGSNADLWCLDAEGAGARVGGWGVWGVVFVYCLGAAIVMLTVFRVVEKLRARRAPKESAS